MFTYITSNAHIISNVFGLVTTSDGKFVIFGPSNNNNSTWKRSLDEGCLHTRKGLKGETQTTASTLAWRVASNKNSFHHFIQALKMVAFKLINYLLF